MHKGPRSPLEKEKSENAGTDVSENPSDRNAFVEATPLDDVSDLFFAVVTVLGIALGINQAERALGRRKKRGDKQEQTKENDCPNFRIFHQSFSL